MAVYQNFPHFWKRPVIFRPPNCDKTLVTETKTSTYEKTKESSKVFTGLCQGSFGKLTTETPCQAQLRGCSFWRESLVAPDWSNERMCSSYWRVHFPSKRRLRQAVGLLKPMSKASRFHVRNEWRRARYIFLPSHYLSSLYLARSIVLN